MRLQFDPSVAAEHRYFGEMQPVGGNCQEGLPVGREVLLPVTYHQGRLRDVSKEDWESREGCVCMVLLQAAVAVGCVVRHCL